MSQAEKDEATRRHLQVVVAVGIISLWGAGAILATFDGSTLLKVTTPLVTMMFGWLFAARVT